MKYKIKVVEKPPIVIASEIVYVIIDGKQKLHAALACPCGCNSVILLNLLKDSETHWKLRKSKTGLATLSPSIWRTSGCKSHFFIRKGNVVWVRENYDFD